MEADDGGRATPPLDAVADAFKSQVMELQDLVLARSMFPATALPDLANVDALVTALESQLETLRRRLQEELDAIPKAKKLVQRSLKEEEKLQHMLANLPSEMRKNDFANQLQQSSSRMLRPFDSSFTDEANECDLKIKDEPVAAPRKGRAPAPRWYISTEEFDSLSSYMRGRLTLEKLNIAINEVASYADTNSHLVTCTKQKLSQDARKKALDKVLWFRGLILEPGFTQLEEEIAFPYYSTDSELRDIAAKDAVKGNHFFLEADIKGPGLKLDTTGKAILTVLRHLGRFHEVRIRHCRVFILSKQA